jgi:hypothetical protein
MIKTLRELPLMMLEKIFSDGDISVLGKGTITEINQAWESIENEIIELHLKHDKDFVKQLFKDMDNAIDHFDYVFENDTMAEINYKMSLTTKAKNPSDVDFFDLILTVEKAKGMPIDKTNTSAYEFYKTYFKLKNENK